MDKKKNKATAMITCSVKWTPYPKFSSELAIMPQMHQGFKWLILYSRN